MRVGGEQPEQRRRVRQAEALPVVVALRALLEGELTKPPGQDGNCTGDPPRAQPVASAVLGRHGHCRGARKQVCHFRQEVLALRRLRRRWRARRIETATRNGLGPEACLYDVPARIADHPIGRIEDPLSCTIVREG